MGGRRPRMRRRARRPATAAALVGLVLVTGAWLPACTSTTSTSAPGTSGTAGTATPPGRSATTRRDAAPSTDAGSDAGSGDASDGGGPSGGDRGTGGAPPSVSRLPDGPITIVTLGDSLTEGDGDDTEKGGYPGRLQAALDASDREGSTVENLGAAGWDSTQLLEGQDGTPAQVPQAVRTIKQAVAKGQPAVAIVLVGSNDLWYLYANDAKTTSEEESEDLARYRSNLTDIVHQLRDAGAVVVLGINDDQSKRPVATDDARRTDAFSAISRDEVAMMSKQAERYATVVREVAQENDALVVDFLHAPFFRDPTKLADDGNHPNGDGYDDMTATWLAALAPLLGDVQVS